MTETNRLTEDEIRQIHLLYAAGYSKQAIANTFGVTNACISYQVRILAKPRPDLKQIATILAHYAPTPPKRQAIVIEFTPPQQAIA